MRNRAHTIKAIILGGAALGALAACSVDQPGHLNVNKPQVQIEDFSALEPVRALDSKALESMAKQYHRHGAGTMDVTVTYDPKSKTDTALRARREAARIAKTLQADGVRDVKTSILPVQDGDAGMKALVRYDSYSALPPEDCGPMPGLESTEDVSFDENYRLGCSVDMLTARQIARPKDLLGREQQETTSDGRRGSNIVETYRTGTPNEPLEGESATGKE